MLNTLFFIHLFILLHNDAAQDLSGKESKEGLVNSRKCFSINSLFIFLLNWMFNSFFQKGEVLKYKWGLMDAFRCSSSIWTIKYWTFQVYFHLTCWNWGSDLWPWLQKGLEVLASLWVAVVWCHDDVKSIVEILFKPQDSGKFKYIMFSVAITD